MENKITKETFINFQKEQERLNEYLLKLIDIGLSLDREKEVIESTWRETFIDFSIEEKGISLHFEYNDHDNCYGFIPYEAIGTEEQFKKWLLNSIQKKREIEERKKQLRKEADEARRRAKINTIKETKIYYKPEDLCCAKCDYNIDMANSDSSFCLVDDEIKNGNDKEQCPFYKKEQNNGKEN